MSENKNIVSEAVLQDLVNEVEGVVSSKVKQDKEGNVIEIHVLADKSRNAKQIVRDIQSAVAAKFGIDLDHRVISVAQINCEDILSREFRLVFKGLEIVSKGLEVEIKVILSHRDRDYCGYQKGVNAGSNINRMVVQAALQAVGDFIELGEAFIAEEVKFVSLANRNVVNVAITYIDKNGEELLIGSSVVSGDLKEAIVRATLDAVNRRITRLVSK